MKEPYKEIICKENQFWMTACPWWMKSLFYFACVHDFCFLCWTVFVSSHKFSHFYSSNSLPHCSGREWASGSVGPSCQSYFLNFFFLNQWITLLIGAIKNFVLSIKLKNRKILIFKQWNLNAVSFPLRFLTQQCFRKNNSLHKVSWFCLAVMKILLSKILST